LLVPLLVEIFQDVRDLAHNVRTARRTARPALGLASCAAGAIELAAKYLRLLGIQRPGPSEHAAAADQKVPAAAFVLHGKPGAEDREVAIALLRARHYAERIRWWVVGQEAERELGEAALGEAANVNARLQLHDLGTDLGSRLAPCNFEEHVEINHGGVLYRLEDEVHAVQHVVPVPRHVFLLVLPGTVQYVLLK
jgi:hypothetical protein